MAQSDTHASLSSIFKSGKYSDLTIRCGNRTFKVHRAVVCPLSKFFAAACDGEFRESITQEIFLEEDDPDTVARMIEYMYTSGYHDENRSGQSAVVDTTGEVLDDAVGYEKRSISTSLESIEQDDTTTIADGVGHWLLNNVRVYAIADRYFMDELKEIARAKFRSQAENLLFAKEFPEIIRELYGSTPSSDRGLRDIASHICAQQGRTIVDSPDLSASIVEIGEFGLDILRETLMKGNERVEEASAKNAALQRKVKDKKGQIGAIKTILTKLVNEIEGNRVSESRMLW